LAPLDKLWISRIDGGFRLGQNKQMRLICRSAGFRLALIGMVLRAILPAGWMPAPITAAHASPFTICSIDGPKHSTPARPSKDHAGAPCVFAAAAPLSSPSADIAAPTPSQRATEISLASPEQSFDPANRFRPNAARAPPAFV
jgi:hypothetical protein